MKTARLTATRLAILLIGVALATFALVRMTEPSRDLSITRSAGSGDDRVPVTFVVHPADGSTRVPGVLVGHGFGSSRQIMFGYAYSLAYAGYAVALWDFGGHGANVNPLDTSRDVLQRDIDAALEYLTARPEVDPQRIAIVGHSMGSGAAMRAGIRLPEVFDAVIAISPTDAPVDRTAPANLLLQAGSWEPRFAANATRLLESAGGEDDGDEALAAGRGRAFRLIHAVEHITILFSAASQRSVVEWLDRTFSRERTEAEDGVGPAGTGYTDRRPLYYAVQFFGWLIAALALGPLIRSAVPRMAGRGRSGLPAARVGWWWIAMLVSPFVATGLLAALSGVGPMNEIAGLLVGGSIAIWFAILGVIWLFVGFRPALPHPRSLLLGLGLFAFLWIAVGLVGQQVAYRWVLVPFRLVRWPFASAALVPWLLAAGLARHGAGVGAGIVIYVAQTVAIVGALLLAGITISGLSIVVLVVPALPLAFAAMTLAGGVVDDPWAYATGNALFFGWLLVSFFPLAG